MNCWHNAIVDSLSSVGAVRYNDSRFTGRAKSWPKSVCVASLPQSYRNEPYQKIWVWVSYKVIALEINILYSNVCILCIQCICTQQVRMPPHGVVIHYTEWDCESSNPRKYTVWDTVDNFWLTTTILFFSLVMEARANWASAWVNQRPGPKGGRRTVAGACVLHRSCLVPLVWSRRGHQCGIL